MKYFTLLILGMLLHFSAALRSQSLAPEKMNFRFPIQFTENAGQWHKEIRYAALRPSESALYYRDGVTFLRTISTDEKISLETPNQAECSQSRLTFHKPSSKLRMRAEDRTQTLSHFYKGNSESRWRENVQNFSRLVYENVWNCIDARYEERNGRLRQTIEVKSGGKVSDIRFNYEGIDKSEISVSAVMKSDSEDGEETAVPVTVKVHDGILTFNVPPAPTGRKLLIYTDFATFFGGSELDFVYAFDLDDSNNYYFQGFTRSLDFPVKNAFQSTHAGGKSDAFVAKLNCDGKTLSFCSYFGGSKQEDFPGTYYYGGGTHNVLDAFVVFGSTYSPDFPIRGDALQKTLIQKSTYNDPRRGCNGFVARFSKNGLLERSTYLGGPGGLYLTSHDVDNSGNIYLFGHVLEDTLWFITPGVVQSKLKYTFKGGESHWVNTYIAAVIAKLTPDLSSIVYATYFFAPNGNNRYYGGCNGDIFHIHVDKKENVTLVGNLSGLPSEQIPIVNPIQEIKFQSYYCPFITKLNSSASDYVFSTLFGRSAQISSSFIDENNNLYITGYTDTTEFIRTKVINFTDSMRYSSFITKISADGKVLFSTVICDSLGGKSFTTPTLYFATDKCGNIVCSIPGGTTGLPVINGSPKLRPDGGDYLCVLDPTGNDILYSTYYNPVGNPYYDILFCWGNPRIDKAGYINFVTTAPRPVYPTTFKMKNAMRDTIAGPSDALIYRFRVPACEPVSCALSGPDTIRVTKKRKVVSPSPFLITVELSNNEAAEQAEMLTGQLYLPDGFYLSTPSQDLSLPPATIQPKTKKTFQWSVRFDSSRSLPQVNEILFLATYRTQSQTFSCPTPVTICQTDIAVVMIDESEPNLSCVVSAPDSLKVDKSAMRYEGLPITISGTIKNNDTRAVNFKHVKLLIPQGMGVELSPPGDSLSPGFSLQPNQTKDASWAIDVKPRPRDRVITLTVIAVDIHGFEVSRCEHIMFIPRIDVFPCQASGPASVRYVTLSGTHTPDPLTVSLSLTNPLDTARRMTSAEIDFSRAPHLALASGETAVKGPFIIYSGNKRYIEWNLRVVPPVSVTVSDTLRFVYRMEGSAEPHYCEWIITIDPVSYEATCLLASPDTLSLTGNFYQPNPFTIRSVIKNTGKTEAPLKTAELQISLPSALSVQPPLVRALSTLSAGDSVVLTWDATALTSLFARNIDFTVTVTDTAGKTAAVCAKSLFLPPVPRGLFCDLTAPDTLKYDVASDTYAPNPFSCAVKLENVLDTAQTSVEAEIDLSGAQHLALVAGETAMKQLPDIIARGQSSVAWNVTVQSSTDKPVTETILVRYRSANEQEWRTCERTILIQGEKRIRSAKCSVKGHDTLWADIRYEDVIPQPAQVQYTITNTGNVPLTGCSAAIILPVKYELEPGCDSIQTYGIIPPGMSASREWFITVNKTIAFPGTDDIQWTWTCDDITTDIPCRHAITLAVGIPHGITLTPWKLRFMAKQDGPLPASQRVKLWPGNGSPVFWQAQSALPWLDWQPQSGTLASPSEIIVCPTTTAMPVGTYSGTLSIISAMQSTPPDVLVEYEIYRILNVERKQSPAGFTLEQNYPNPVSGDRYSVIRFTLTEKSFAVLKLYDAFGRELMTLHSGETQAGTYSIRLDAAVREQLPAGVYYYTLNTAGRSMTRMMIVR